MDEEKRRISLGMKNSYFSSDNDLQMLSEEETDEDIEENGSHDQSLMLDGSLPAVEDSDIESEGGEALVLAQTESRASVPPLEVTLEDIEQPVMDNVVSQNMERIDVADNKDEKNKRQAKKKAKEERYCHCVDV